MRGIIRGCVACSARHNQRVCGSGVWCAGNAACACARLLCGAAEARGRDRKHAGAGGRSAAKLGAMGWTGIDHPCRRQLCCVDLCCLTRLRRAHQHGRMVDTERDDLMLRDKCKLCRGGGSMSCRKCYGKGMLQLRSRALRSSAGGCAIFRRGCVCLWTRCCVLLCCCPAVRMRVHE